MNLTLREAHQAIFSLPLQRPAHLPPAAMRIRLTALACGAIRVTRTMRDDFLEKQSDTVMDGTPGECRVTETDIPYHYADENLTIQALMKIRLFKRFSPDRFPFSVLRQEYGVNAVRGPRGIPYGLSEALKKEQGGEEHKA